MSHPARRSALASLALVAAATGYAVAAPGPAAATPPMILGHVPEATAPTSATIIISKGAQTHGYTTKVVTISQGGTLSVLNRDTQEHTVTADAVNRNDVPLFDKYVEPGTETTIAAASKLAAGRYTFHCRFHAAMIGTLIVEGGSGGTTGVIPHFTLPLKRPPVIRSAKIHLVARKAAVRVLPTGPKTTMWTFGGSYPAPTIIRPAGHDTKLLLTNRLPKRAGALTLHFHGDHHTWQDDGQPDRFLVRHHHSKTYDFPLTDGGKPETDATDFYHDHRMNETARNNWHGLQGFFLVTDHRERSLPLPRGKYDVPLMVADRSLTPSNQLTNPFAGRTHSMTGMTGPHAPPGDGTVGSRILVDGRFAPHLGVSARRYRLRLLNTSDFQSYDFALTDGRPFIQVGNGSGLLPHPVIRQNILLGPAQRADVVVDFGGELHQRIELESIARPHRPPSGVGTPPAQIMQFRVNTTAPDHSRVPANLEQPPPIHASKKPSYTWTVGLGGDAATGTYWTINGQPFNPHRVDVEVPLGATRTWRLRNMSPITHYIHLHEEQWHTLLRDGKKPPPWERGLEDTWRLDPGESVVVAAKFTDYTGVFMLHCHMLDHEDDGMMAQFAVVDRHTRALPRGYHLPRQSSGSHVAVMSGMDMSGGGPGFVASLTGWQRNLAEGLEALLIELCAVGLFIGLRRVWRIS